MFTFSFLDARFPSYGGVNSKTSAKTRVVYREKIMSLVFTLLMAHKVLLELLLYTL